MKIRTLSSAYIWFILVDHFNSSIDDLLLLVVVVWQFVVLITLFLRNRLMDIYSAFL